MFGFSELAVNEFDKWRDFCRSRKYRPTTPGGSSWAGQLDQLADASGAASREWDLEHDRHVLAPLLEYIRPRDAGFAAGKATDPLTKTPMTRKQPHMHHIFIPTLILTFASVNFTAAAEPGPSKDIPELAVLSHWAGNWAAKIEKPTLRTGESHSEWIVGGRYLQQTWKVAADADNPEFSGTWLMTFDVRQMVYRQWQFNSDGFTAEATGKWDAATRTMTWTTRDTASGNTTVNKDVFLNADEQPWSIITTDRQGNTVFKMNGRNKRQGK